MVKILGKKSAYLVIAAFFTAFTVFMAGCTPEEYEVEVQADPEDAGEIIGEGTYEEGEEVTVEAESEEGYEFEKWEEDGERLTSEKDYKLEVSEDITLEAQFKKKEYEVSLELNDEEKGEVSGSGTYEYGEEVTVEAKPEEGYEFLDWEIDGDKVSDDKNYEFKTKQDTDLLAKFDEKEYK